MLIVNLEIIMFKFADICRWGRTGFLKFMATSWIRDIQERNKTGYVPEIPEGVAHHEEFRRQFINDLLKPLGDKYRSTSP